ncbi:IS91 family transposase [Anaerosolibacter sp.]|uniref:IS91 family transposase n=1 Tax=Anaerosolibacter sp. TaxID=1872527 RepID=UPI0039EF589A
MVEVQDIFNQYGQIYRQKHRLPNHILKAMSAIESCRTHTLGGHVDECDSCGHIRVSYNSCRNRHCPKCQTLTKERWIENRKKDLLPVGYFHVVFTMPEELNFMTLLNQREVYSILFKAVSETLLEVGRDAKYLGAEIGFISILHTWGQNLMDHPHIHCIVPGGGISFDGKRWIHAKAGFFIPVKVLSRKFRGKLLYYLKRSYSQKKLKFIGDVKFLKNEVEFKYFVDKLYKKECVVYCKPPFKSAEHVLEYLGRYTHRVAISNHRIVKLENGQVTFWWRDYRDGNKKKLMTLTAEEFIRRFLMHILPSRFVKIRHYGILSNRNRKIKIAKCRVMMGVVLRKDDNPVVKLSVAELLLKLTGVDITRCPCCEKGKMLTKEKPIPKNCSPPEREIKTA